MLNETVAQLFERRDRFKLWTLAESTGEEKKSLKLAYSSLAV
jgi:hypothetical protein